MSVSIAALEGFLRRNAVLVEITGTKGSTPRERGAWMVVSENEMLGTIGGGQLEFIAMDTARQMLRGGEKMRVLDVPLGPDIGQCCGGRVALALSFLDGQKSKELLARHDAEMASWLPVYVMGAGHVGRALAQALALLPVKVVIVDSRAGVFEGLPGNVETRVSVLPEAEVRKAPPGSSFVILTHDHAEDFLIAREALLREDALYVGMIGSKTKRATFATWLRGETGSATLAEKLICPIGNHIGDDKRPEVIAALVAAEILVHTGQPLEGGFMDRCTTKQVAEGN
ncbi:MAG TPA: xanthine dehydrogenase accessory protein XdhC [Devosia sp.]|nr:xanthine dehydrogenase accessory protein XdhC [Devosia sp.]